MALSKNSKKLLMMFLFTAMFLLIYRFGTRLQLPFVNGDMLTGQTKEMFGFLDVFSGQALSNFSILALGISPYITASIVVQLLQMDILPVLKEWSEEGPAGKQKINQLTKYIALGLAFVQSLTLTLGLPDYFTSGFSNAPINYVYLALVATAGTAFSMWLAEKITKRGIGNGTSMLIVAGILSSFPAMFGELGITHLSPGQLKGILTFIAIVLTFLAVIVGIVFMEQATRKIPIQYANRPAAANFRGKSDSNIPIKLNSASVIPVIFAATLMSIPTTIIQMTGNSEAGFGRVLYSIFSQTETIGFVIYVVLIFVFSFFYAFLQMNPEKMAENLQKNNAYIPGVRPGEETASFISRVLFKVTMVGATYLSIVATLPIILTKIFNLSSSVQIGGTGLIIVVGVAIETAKQIKNQKQDQQYRGFIN
ncbi:MAG: preprotein translocase subunit SecY [Bacilli bacterium]